MRLIKYNLFIALALLSSWTLGSEIYFKALVNGTPLNCNQEYKDVGAEKVSMVVNDFRFYASTFAVRDKKGHWHPTNLIDDSVWQSNDVVLLDFENGQGSCISGSQQTNQKVRIKLPISLDDIVSLKFEVGIPFHLNHIDPIKATAPLNTTAMFWSWQNGYKFIKLDARFSAIDKVSNNITRSGFPVHIGSTMCTSDSATTAPTACKNPNRVHVELEGFSFYNSQIGIDIGKLLESTFVMKNTPGTPAGCMSFPNDPDCIEIMNNLGLPYQNTSSIQKIFTLLSR